MKDILRTMMITGQRLLRSFWWRARRVELCIGKIETRFRFRLSFKI